MLPSNRGFNAPYGNERVPRPQTNDTSSPALHPGHHRDKLDLIRDSLRPFEQGPDGVIYGVGETSYSTTALDDTENIMLNALTQGGYDRLVNFKSVTDAAKVLSSLKQVGPSNHNSLVKSPNLNSQSSPSASRSTPSYLLAASKSLPVGDPGSSLSVNGFEPFMSKVSYDAHPANNQYDLTGEPETSLSQRNIYDLKYSTNDLGDKHKPKMQTEPVPVIRSRLERVSTAYLPSYSQVSPKQNNSQRQLDAISMQTSRLHIQNRVPASQARPMDTRSVSPLPASVSNRLKLGTYEKATRPCRPAMFRFFMEQHTEKLIQQWQERNQRALQLAKDMEAAKFADNMKDKMLKFLRQKESRYLRLRRQKMNKGMFDLIRHIGVGAFGKVTLVKKKDTGEIYAMKTLSKEDVIQKQQAAHVKAERDILAEANSEWIVKLFFSFQDAKNLYFIMEYVPGGDLMQLLIQKGIFTETLARVYTAELTCALEYVHSLGFIHRDIKPDNILIDKEGHIKLTDFGLCTGLRWTHDKRHYISYDCAENGNEHYREESLTLPPEVKQGSKPKLLEYRQHKKRNQAHSMVGTGNYMAPEVIERVGHSQLCDWWSVGVILYEMVFGRPPFLSQTDNPVDTQYMILNWQRFLDLRNPRLSNECIDIIAGFCRGQRDRLGRNGAVEVKAHAWFQKLFLPSGQTAAAIDFVGLRQVTPEFRPRVEHPEDTSNFDTFEVNADEFFRADDPNASAHNPAFFDFTFRHFFASDGLHNNRTPMGRAQTRPSLSHLIQADCSTSSSSENSAAEATPTAAAAAPLQRAHCPPHPIFGRGLRCGGPADQQQSALYAAYARSGSATVSHPVQGFSSPLEADEDDLTHLEPQ